MAIGSDLSESKFEKAISTVLISGVIGSLLLEGIGIVSFYRTYGHLRVLEKESLFLHGTNFFNFLTNLLRGNYPHESPILLMSFGIAFLVLTPYVRVALSVFYFAREKNVKYVLITVFVLILLTLSLAVVPHP